VTNHKLYREKQLAKQEGELKEREIMQPAASLKQECDGSTPCFLSYPVNATAAEKHSK